MPRGTEKVLYSFRASASDGTTPYSGLTDVKGTLYGTTFLSGAYGYGTVFSITTGGKEKVVHSFGNGTDGKGPQAGLTDVGGTLYGTTIGGGSNCGTNGWGTVFKITTSGTENVKHSFGMGTDGISPYARLIDVSGLYGTTYKGGTSGYGTAFSIAP